MGYKNVAEGLVISIVTADSQECILSIITYSRPLLSGLTALSVLLQPSHCELQYLEGGSYETQMKENLAQSGRVKEDFCLLYVASVTRFGTFESFGSVI